MVPGKIEMNQKPGVKLFRVRCAITLDHAHGAASLRAAAGMLRAEGWIKDPALGWISPKGQQWLERARR